MEAIEHSRDLRAFGIGGRVGHCCIAPEYAAAAMAGVKVKENCLLIEYRLH